MTPITLSVLKYKTERLIAECGDVHIDISVEDGRASSATLYLNSSDDGIITSLAQLKRIYNAMSELLAELPHFMNRTLDQNESK